MQHIAFVSNTGLVPTHPDPAIHWGRAADRVRQLQPTLTVHLGGLTLSGAQAPDELQRVANHLKLWPSPVHCLPGSRDLGGERGPTPGALMRFRRWVGADRWCVPVGRWLLIGLNSHLFGSDSEAEHDQWDWLDTVAAADTRRNLLLCLPKPMPRTALEGLSMPEAHLPNEATERLLGGAIGRRLGAVCAGGLPPADAREGYRTDHLPVSDHCRAIQQLVIGDFTGGLGWVTLHDSGIELGYATLGHGPAEPVTQGPGWWAGTPPPPQVAGDRAHRA